MNVIYKTAHYSDYKKILVHSSFLSKGSVIHKIGGKAASDNMYEYLQTRKSVVVIYF